MSCKNRFKSGESVKEKDLGSILDKVRQHKCEGFLIITNTILSTSASELLKSLDRRNDGEIYTECWDRLKLSHILSQDECDEVFKKFFPRSYQRYKFDSPLSSAIATLQGVISEDLLIKIKEEVRSNIERRKILSGDDIWPYDKDSAKTIDAVLYHLLERSAVLEAARAICDNTVEFDAVIELFSKISDLCPNSWKEFLESIIAISTDEGIQFNALMYLRDQTIMPRSHEYRLAAYLNESDVLDIYAEELQQEVIYKMSEMYQEEELFEELKGALHYELDCGYAVVDKIQIDSGKAYFTGRYDGSYRVDYDDPDVTCDYVNVFWEFSGEHGDFGLKLEEW